MNNGVYKIINTLTNDCYVGSCAHVKGFKLRWNNHINSLNKNNHHSIVLQRAWNKYGKENFVFEVIEECEAEKCIEREQYYLDSVSPAYNILKVAGSSLGRKLTTEQIQKLKDRSYNWMRGENNWNKSEKNKKLSRERFDSKYVRGFITKETYKKISNSLRGRKKTEEHKIKISKTLTKYAVPTVHQEKIKDVLVGDKNPMFNKTHTTENKLIMSNKSLEFWSSEDGKKQKIENSERAKCLGKSIRKDGENHPRYNPTIIHFINVKTGEDFSGTTLNFRKRYNASGEIYNLVNGKYKQYKGWKIK